MNTTYDAIIIGSGIGGLTVGALLSKNYKVLILEKNKNFGGYCTCFNRKGFKFEAAIQSINGIFETSPIMRILKETKVLNRVSFVSPDILYRTIFPDFDLRVPQGNVDAYSDMLFSRFPDEKDGIRQLFALMEKIYFEMKEYYCEATPRKSPLLLEYCRRSSEDIIDRFVHDKKLKAIISQYWLYRGLPPSMLSAITFSYIWYDYTVNGSYFPRGGTASIIDALIDTIESNGGNIVAGKEVNKIHIENSRIVSVETTDGDIQRARFFVSNGDVINTFNIMKGADRSSISPFINKLKENSSAISAFKIYLGLDIDAASLGLDDYEIFINPSYDMDKMFNAAVNCDLNNTSLSITVYSNITDAFCSKGKSVISLSALCGYDYWKNLPKDLYERKKKELSDMLLSKCVAAIPGMKKIFDHINVRLVSTPLTMERYTGNNKGSIYGWSKRSVIEEMRFINPHTPIKNLFLSSHWTKMGGGIGGVLLTSDRVNNFIRARDKDE